MVRRRRRSNHFGPHLGGSFGLIPGTKARTVIYARNSMTQIARQSKMATAFAEFANEANSALDFGLVEGEAADWIDLIEPRSPTKELWLKLQSMVNAAADKVEDAAVVSPVLQQVCNALSLDTLDAEILQLMVDYSTYRMTVRLWDCLSDAEGEPTCLRLDPRFIGIMLGKDEDIVGQRLVATSPLRESGLLRMDQNSGVSVLPRLLMLLRQPPADSNIDARSALLGAQQTAELTLEDFAHLGSDTERVVALLRGALNTHSKGVNVVIHGPPGTGKTELAKAIAAAVGVPLHSIGETDDEGGEPCRQERLAELQMAQRLMANASPAILLFDEGEDLFGDVPDFFALFGARRHTGSKAFMHRLLENGTAPMILTANSLASFGEAVLRRMTACIEVRVPPVHVRAKIWAHAAAAEGIEAEPLEFASLARQLPCAPALARSAMRAANLAGGDKDTVRWALSGVAKAMTGKPLAPITEAVPFDLDLVNADVDLVALADRLCQPDAPRKISLLLSGPSGSGKSAFARHLAERMGLEVLQKRSSDLLGKYVGETERRIASSFAEAIDNNAFLIFDECDSLLGDRVQAERAWQVSQVNEMLTWMETHPLPFCCTTNFMERVDKASMRRFLVKAKFKALRADQCELAFQRFFDFEPPHTIATLENLTPSDFTLVHKMASLHGRLDDPAFLISALEGEQSARYGKKNPLGFLH